VFTAAAVTSEVGVPKAGSQDEESGAEAICIASSARTGSCLCE
jgi:hypothetical protein